MTITDAMGYFAASLVLATFCAKQMVLLRALAIGSNLAFITYGLAARLWPIVTLHFIMLPLNVTRLREALASLGPLEHLQYSNAVASRSGAKPQDQMTREERGGRAVVPRFSMLQLFRRDVCAGGVRSYARQR